MALNKGDIVKIEYEGTLDNGEVFDSSKNHDKPLEFTIGENQVIPGFEQAVMGLEKGEEKDVKINSSEAYGNRHEELVKKIPKTALPQSMQLQAGMVLGLASPDGRQIPAKISAVGENDVDIDLNHPLAGQNLNFKIKLIEVNSK